MEMAAPPAARVFLFLQGPLSPLYRRLGRELERGRARVHRINLCIGDRLDWPFGAISYKGRPEHWGAFVAAFLREKAVTDLVVHSECRFYHRIAADEARALGVRVFVTELGYLRPDWMTLERDGTGANSRFPRTPEAIRAIARQVGPVDLAPRYPARFWDVAVPDLRYNLANTLFWFLYPHYRRHTIYFPPLEYAAWAMRLATARRRHRLAQLRTQEVLDAGVPFYVFGLQLEGDFQIRENSGFGGIEPAIEAVLHSFARAAPPGARLLVKSHPLDNGLHRWAAKIDRIAARRGLRGRVALLDGGNLAPLLERACGFVSVNSSAGIEALRAGCPTKALAPAIYDVPGLTHQGGLDAFWTAPMKPDASLLDEFLRALAATVQVRGTIYSAAGLEAAVAGMARTLLTLRTNVPDACLASAPRLAHGSPAAAG
jgi:capsular polysaccharide export protein